MDSAITEVPRLVRDLYKVVSELERLFAAQNKKFTPDGHLVGSLGEVLAAHMYGLDLHPNSYPGHDAVDRDGRQVQIKATQGRKGVALRSEPDHLIVLRIDSNGQAEEIYNGPGNFVWKACSAGKNKPSNGQYAIALSTLKKLMDEVVSTSLRLPQFEVSEMTSPGLIDQPCPSESSQT